VATGIAWAVAGIALLRKAESSGGENYVFDDDHLWVGVSSTGAVLVERVWFC